MSHTHQGIGAMPGPSSSKAPSFNGEMSELSEFFEFFEDLASTYGLTDADKCKCVSRDYTIFKKNILDQYPGASKGQRYTVRDLERVVVNQADSDIYTETELIQYYRQFRAIAVWLVTNKKISERDRNKYFWQGLPVRARQQILQRLELKDPNFDRNESADFEKVLEAGRHVFSDEAFDAEFNDPITLRIKSIRDRRVPTSATVNSHAPHEVQTRTVRFRTPEPPVPSTHKSTLDEVDTLARQMHGLDIADVTYSSCYTRLVCLAPAAAQAWAPPCTRQLSANVSAVTPHAAPARSFNDSLCPFCGQQHLMRNCPTAAEYIRTGRVIWENHFYTYPDGSRIYRRGNETLQQAVERRHANTIPSPPPAPHLPFPPAHSSQIEDDEPSVEALAITRSKAKSAASDNTGPAQEPSVESNSTVLPRARSQSYSSEAPPSNAYAKKTPAFIYESKAATPDAASRIYQNMLNTAVPNVTISDLLAISPDLRREAVDHCRTHRIANPMPAVSMAALTASGATLPPQIEHATPLRELKVMLNGIHEEVGLLDEGSELVVIREDVWKKTRAPINKDVRMRMQTANGSS
ncbi:hypothetical protein M405DRAFT_870035 [Rhizopogon salebrosus TDB-379]|nr:hypothetical protein M405DRAFT_870035 [Rhizopogon salebrosus TDB-379]